MHQPNSPTIDWDTLNFPGENISARFVDGEPAHLVMIDRDVLEDGLGTSGLMAQQNMNQHRDRVQQAINCGFARGEWQELVQIGTHRRVYHLWLKRDDFGPAD